MRRAGILALGLILAAPLGAQAQNEPSNSMHTRSVENYLREASKSAHPDDRKAALDNALEVALEGVERDADNPQIWYLLGQTYLETGDLVKADSALDRAESLWPDYAKEISPLREAEWVEAYNQGVRALQADDNAAAMAAFEQATMIYDGRPEALISLASLQQNANQPEAAAASYRKALEIIRRPATAELSEEIQLEWAENEEIATFNLARLLAAQDQHDEAAELFAAFIERNPDNVQARVNLALMYTQAGRAADAARIYTELLDQPGLDEIDYFNIGVGLYRAEQHEQAVAAFSKSIAANPYSRDALFNLGQAQFAHANALLEGGDTTAALAVFTGLGSTAQQLIALDPAGQPAYMMLAQSQRSRAELGGDDALRQEVLATLEQVNALPFRVENVRMRLAEGAATLTGSIVNGKTLAAGIEASLQVSLLDRGGAELATQTVAVPLGATDEAVTFEVEIPVTGDVAGWKYTIVE